MAYGYLAYKLITYDNYQSFFHCFTNAKAHQWFCLGVCLILMPLNFLVESWKWSYLVNTIHPLSLKTSCRSVLIGQIGAFPTPNRLGEYPARVILFPENVRLSAVALGFTGSLVQTLVIGVFGLFGALLFIYIPNSSILSLRYYLYFVGACLLLLILFLIYLPKLVGRYRFLKNKDWLQSFKASIASASLSQLFSLSAICFLRYFIFSCQFYLMLQFCDVQLTPLQALAGIPLMYLFITITPSFFFSDLAVRCSYAIFIFSFFSVNTPGIAVASMLLWILNSSILMLIGSYYWWRINVKI